MNRKLLNQILVIVIITVAACTARGADERQLIAVLQSNVGAVEKCAACQQLRTIGTAESVPALAALLSDERVGHAARYALEGMPYAEAGSALREAIGKTSGPVKAGLIDSVGWRGDTRAVGLLIPLLSDGDAAVATAAAAALGRIGGDDAEPALAAACEKSKGETGIAAAEALLQCAERRLSASDDVQAAGLYDKVMAAGPSSVIRAAAWRGLALSDGERRGSLVVETLGGGDETLRPVAFKLVRETEDGQLVKTCMQNWKTLPGDAQVLLIDVISARSYRAWLADIVKACSSSQEAVRVAAIKAVGVLGDSANVALLAEHSARTSGIEQAAAAESLGILKGPNVNMALAAELKSADNSGKVVICRALLERNAVDAAPALVEAARTNGGGVRAEALKALRDLAGKDEIPALVELLATSGPTQRDDAGKTLAAVARRCGARGEATELLLAKYSLADAPGLKNALLAAMGEIQDGKALPVLLAALSKNDSDSQIRTTAIKALGAWPSYEPAKALLDISRSSKDRTERVLALRGCIDLTAAHAPADQKLADYEQVLKIAEDNEKRRVLGKLADIKNPAALKMAQGYLSSPETANEAALAVTAIGGAIYSKEPEAVAAAMHKVRGSAVGEAAKEQAGKILGQIDGLKDYLLNWEVAGPYMQQGKNCTELFDIPFGPEIEGAEVRWRAMPVDTASEHTGYLNLLKELNGGEQRVAYLRTPIESQSERPARLEIFSDDGVKAWLNGKVVHSNNAMRPIMPEPDRVNVTLAKGANRLVLKITQNNLPWGAAVRLRD
jgi:HEAT repeat protein